MKLPQLNVLPQSREVTDVFGGYNHNLRIGNGEFYDMRNMTSDHFPSLSPRTQRGVYTISGNPVTNAQGLIEKDALCYVQNGNFVINGFTVPMELDNEPKTMVSMGAYVIILPDKKYINTINYEDRGNIEAEAETVGTVHFSLCKVDGTDYGYVSGETEPGSKDDNTLWLDTSSSPHTLKQYSESNKAWVSIPTTYIKIQCNDWGADAELGLQKSFKEGDGVMISGITADGLTDLNNTMVLWEVGKDYIVVTGFIGEVDNQTDKVKIERRMPAMDFLIESENRLWGCRYGEDINGNVVNEIYASKLGDFKNWHCYAGISTDSYAATVGTDGVFTGAITHMGYPLFFKENYLHKVYGNYPANYQIQTTACMLLRLP